MVGKWFRDFVSFGERVGLMGVVLFHATDEVSAQTILKEGFLPGAYFTDMAEIAAYYAETVCDEGKEPVVLAVDLSDLLSRMDEKDVLPDFVSIEEPITTVLGKSEDQVIDEWVSSEKTWRDSLKVCGGLRCMDAVPAEIVSLDDEFVLPEAPATRMPG